MVKKKTKSKKPKIYKPKKPKIKIPKAHWTPQPGPQTWASICPVDLIFVGGERGGGKSDLVIGRHLIGVDKYSSYWNGLIVRKKFKDFAELRRRWDELIAQGLPAQRIGGDQQTNYIRFPNHGNAQIIMTAIQRPEMLDSFQSQQFTEISIDEAPTISFIGKMIDKLKGSMRSPHGVPSHMLLTGNPGGPGAIYIREIFIKPDPLGLGKVQYDEVNFSTVFIKASLEDNKILQEKDPNYKKRLNSIKDEALKRAWFGDWYAIVDQAFNFTEANIISPIPVPEYAPVYMSFDWGYSAPFSVGWWWTDANNRLYRFAEWYGWNGRPNEGLKLPDSKIALGIIEREKNLDIHKRVLKRFAPPDAFTRKPGSGTGIQGPSTAEEFQKFGLKLTSVYPDRMAKIKQFRERLYAPPDDMPMLVVYDTCKRFIETVPNLCLDEDNIEDIDTHQEDHVYDETALMCMARPISLSEENVNKIIEEEKKKAVLIKLDNMSRAAWKELDKIKEQLDNEYEYEKIFLSGGMW